MKVSIKKAWMLLFLVLAMAQYVRSQEPEPLLTPQQMPNAVRYLPAPPDTLSEAFAYDVARYRWGKEVRRDSARLDIAVRDANWTINYICREFGEPFGMTLSKERTPAIYQMLYVSLITADQAGRLAKNHYHRTRPYVYYGEPTIYPADEEELRNNGSYPSGHTIEGWCAALLLSELNPGRADTLLARGYMYGQSRVIAGYHWQSDVDASRMLAAACFARLHSCKEFLEDMEDAKEEFEKLNK